MKLEIILLHCKTYSFYDESKQLRSGMKVKYLINNTMKPVEVSDNEKGCQVAESNLDIEVFKKINVVPAIYEATMNNNVNSKGQILQKMVDLEYLGEIC